jgi:ribonuclease G
VCSGEGVVKSEETIAIEFARHLRHMVHDAGPDGPEAYLLRINPRVTAWFIADGARELHALEVQTGRYFHFEGSEGLPLDHFTVTMEGTRAEIEERSVPFRAGEEVHVDLVEPHMYNEDDAVAKVDGYLIDVVNGVAFVGEKKLVRIEEAGRTIATAVLVGADAEVAAEAARERAGAREQAAVRARRSVAAKKGAAKRRERVAEAAATLVDETPSAAAGTAPAAAEDAGEPAKPRRRSRAKKALEERPSAEAGAPRAEEEGETPKAKGRTRRRKAADEQPEPEAPVAEQPGDGESEDDDALSSRPRRRGRRGGRRRSRAKAQADAEVTE